jgi:hypothetical protein
VRVCPPPGPSARAMARGWPPTTSSRRASARSHVNHSVLADCAMKLDIRALAGIATLVSGCPALVNRIADQQAAEPTFQLTRLASIATPPALTAAEPSHYTPRSRAVSDALEGRRHDPSALCVTYCAVLGRPVSGHATLLALRRRSCDARGEHTAAHHGSSTAPHPLVLVRRR